MHAHGRRLATCIDEHVHAPERHAVGDGRAVLGLEGVYRSDHLESRSRFAGAFLQSGMSLMR